MEEPNQEDRRRRGLEPFIERTIYRMIREQQHQDQSGSLQFGGHGWWAKVGGDRLIGLLLVVACVAFISYFLYRHDVDMKEQAKIIIDSEHHSALAISENKETVEAMIYVLTLTQQDREKLNLSKPRKLNDMQR